MRKMRWTMDGAGGGGFWELDMSTPATLEGQARPVPGLGDPVPLPLGLSRGTRLSRPKQVDFLQRFMAAPFVPAFSAASDGLSLQRVLTIPFSQNWFATLLGQFNLQKFVYSLKQSGGESSGLRKFAHLLRDKSLYALGLYSEILLTPEATLLLGGDAYGDSNNTIRKKTVYHHKFPHHSLTMEATWPSLFVDKSGSYWDVPFTMAVDLASVGSDSNGTSYHLCMHHNSGMPKQFFGGENKSAVTAPAALLPGFSLKSAFLFKKNVDIWRSNAQKLRMVQPFDIFLSNPHISASGIIGAAVTASFGDIAVKSLAECDFEHYKGIHFSAPAVKSAFIADAFSSLSFTAQHGNFQRLLLDLTRLQTRLDFPSGSKFLSGAAHLTLELLNSKQPTIEAVQAICPNVTVSLQQQIAGPFSFRVDSGVAVNLKSRDWRIGVENPVFAIEYALQVLGSAKAVAWYSPKQQEFMVELRFFET
ncbi:protein TRIGALACTOSYLDIACYLGLYCEROL 4, chloroplastic isoform X2 [Tripterygium wilfordii]|uniref:protein TRIGALACTOSYLDIACYLGLYCEROL 4, chloroplastic isoform X2 n=1 Tax=Tripterygium wilfordii TaxID=458696 RepID=UPI0018F8253A|nr:protein TRIGALACTOSYLDIACYLGLYCEROL 4, chloroplastic isoform X2 [Tripterygium wilfordii]